MKTATLAGRIKPYNSKVFCFLMLLPFLETDYLRQINVVHEIALFWKIAAACVILFVWLLDFRMTKATLALVLYALVVVWSTLKNGGDVSTAIYHVMQVLALVLLVETASRQNAAAFLDAAVLAFEILTYINLILLILHPEGLYNFGQVNTYHFAGHRNVMMRMLFPGVCCSAIRSHCKYRKLDLRCWMLMIALLVSIMLVWSATAMVGYAVFLLCVIVFYNKPSPKWMNYTTGIIAFLVVFFGIVVFRLQDNFAYFVQTVLKKDLTFTGRTMVWDKAMYWIGMRPWLGWGIQTEAAITGKLIATSTHNFVLALMLEGGLLDILSIGLFLYAVGTRLMDMQYGELGKLFTFACFTYFMMWNFEPFEQGNMRLMLAVFTLAYNIDYCAKIAPAEKL